MNDPSPWFTTPPAANVPERRSGTSMNSRSPRVTAEITSAYEARSQGQRGRLDFHQAHSVLITTSEQQACEVVVCGPEAFNIRWKTFFIPEHIELRLESFRSDDINPSRDLEPGSWRRENDALVRQQADMGAKRGNLPPTDPGRRDPSRWTKPGASSTASGAKSHRDRSSKHACDTWNKTCGKTGSGNSVGEELQFGARLARRQAERCVGRLYWQSSSSSTDASCPLQKTSPTPCSTTCSLPSTEVTFNLAISVFDPGDAKGQHHESGIPNSCATQAFAIATDGKSVIQRRTPSQLASWNWAGAPRMEFELYPGDPNRRRRPTPV